MHILVAPDGFKGSLTPFEVAAAKEKGAREVCPSAQITVNPMVDGGENTVATLSRLLNLRHITLRVPGPLGREVIATACVGPDEYVMLDYASVAGLRLLDPAERDPLRASSHGFGEAMRQLLELGHRRFRLFLGGSATVDAGAGALQALGVRLLDAQGHDLEPGGGALERLERIDSTGMDSRLAGCHFILAYGVSNPLCGKNGAARVFGPQKGARGETLRQLERGLERFAEVVEAHTGVDIAQHVGGAAAGGVGAGLSAFLDCKWLPGFDHIADLVSLVDRVQATDLVFTGEGRLDGQTRSGKVVYGLGKLGRSLGTPTIALVGQIEPSASND